MKRLLLATLLSTNSYGAMIKSERATIADSPDIVQVAMYKALNPVKIRDFPSMQGNITGYLDKGELIQGTDIEGIWLHVFENEYISLLFLERIKDEILKESIEE